MEPARSIARLGFRRWYERQLFESFAWLTTCLLSGVVFAAVIEFVGLTGPGLRPYVAIVVLYVVGLMGVSAWRTFWRLLRRAQSYADRAVCPGCGAYGLLEVTAESEAVAVRCRRCARQWEMSPPGDPPED
jgi:hypothetical protein